MLTPQEVAQRSFSKASFGGYNMAMVDDFLDEVTTDYEALFNENALLKQKLGILSGKIREYQSTEEAMRKTLLAAQEMSDKLVKETEAKCARMVEEAQSRSTTQATELAQSFSAEEQKLQAAKASVEQYKAQIRAVCQQQLDYLTQLDQLVPPTIPQSAQRVESAVEDIQAAVEKSVAQEEELFAAAAQEESGADREPEPQPSAEPPAQPVVEESSVSLYEQLMAHRKAAQEAQAEKPAEEPDPTAPTRRIERRSLEFGKDFEIE